MKKLPIMLINCLNIFYIEFYNYLIYALLFKSKTFSFKKEKTFSSQAAKFITLQLLL